MLKVYFKNPSVVPAEPVSGVTALFTYNGSFVFSATSGEDGLVAYNPGHAGPFLLYASHNSPAYMTTNPTQLEYNNTIDVTYIVQVTLSDREPAPAPLCRCVGYLRNSDGSLVSNAQLKFTPVDTPFLLQTGSDIGILPGTVTVDIVNGFVDVWLLRELTYNVDVPWVGDVMVTTIPDVGIANLPDVIFPVPAEITFDPDTLSLTVNEEADVTATVVYRSGFVASGSTLGSAWPVSLKTSDPDVVTVRGNADGTITACGTGAGTATITAERDLSGDPIRIYDDPGVSGSLSVTVSV
jgi:hypothetical protein